MNKREIDKAEQVSKYLKQSFVAYVQSEIDKGNPIPSQRQFAEWLGLEPQLLSMYISKKRIPSVNFLRIMANKLGYEIFDILGIDHEIPDDPDFRLIADNWFKLTDLEKKELTDLVKRIISTK